MNSASGSSSACALDHDDVGLVADVNQVEVAFGALVVGRVDDELAVDAADAHRADRAGERDVGEAEGGGGAVHREDVGVVLAVGAEQDGDDLGVVEITLREERPQRAVGHPAGEDFLFGRAAFALEVATGENAGGGGFFLVFHGEREPIWPGFTLVAETAVTRTMVSPQRTVTAPSASLASLPVSNVIGLAPTSLVSV